MKKSVPNWLVMCMVLLALSAGIALDHHLYKPRIGRDLNEVESRLQLGMRSSEVHRVLGEPDAVLRSNSDFAALPYPTGPLSGEQVLLYGEYPWGTFIYVDKKHHRVTRLVLVRHF